MTTCPVARRSAEGGADDRLRWQLGAVARRRSDARPMPGTALRLRCAVVSGLRAGRGCVVGGRSLLMPWGQRSLMSWAIGADLRVVAVDPLLARRAPWPARRRGGAGDRELVPACGFGCRFAASCRCSIAGRAPWWKADDAEAVPGAVEHRPQPDRFPELDHRAVEVAALVVEEAKVEVCRRPSGASRTASASASISRGLFLLRIEGPRTARRRRGAARARAPRDSPRWHAGAA